VKSDPILVDLPELRTLMDGVKLEDSRRNEYIHARWLKYVEWWDSRASKAKSKYQATRAAVVVAGALTPALVGLREVVGVQHYYGPWLAVASIIASLVVAIGAGLDSLFNYGDIWREKRAAAELLKNEGFSFLHLIGEYKQDKTNEVASERFAANVEQLIRSEIKDIVAVGDKSSTKPYGDPKGSKPSSADHYKPESLDIRR
jgi:Protein of unknown function (DUF4231)